MARLWRWLQPDQWVGSVADIDIEALQAQGIRGLILDLDDTLVAALDRTPTAAIHAWVTRVKETFAFYILSNNPNPERVQHVADLLEVPCAARAAKPLRAGFRQALRDMGLQPAQVAIIGDQLFTDILGGNRLGAHTILATPMSPERKPWRKLMRLLEGMLLHDAASLRDRLQPEPDREPVAPPKEHP